MLLERTTVCPYCGTPLTHPLWKKAVAWIFLLLIVYGLARCHLQLMEGFGPLHPVGEQIPR